MEDVHLVVRLDQAVTYPAPFTEGVGRLLPHLVGNLGHELNDASTACTHLRPQMVHRPLGDVLGQVGAAFQLRDDQEHGHHVAQLVTLDGPLLQLLPNKELHFGGQVAHVLITVDDRLAQQYVASQQGMGGTRKSL